MHGPPRADEARRDLLQELRAAQQDLAEIEERLGHTVDAVAPPVQAPEPDVWDV